MTNPLHDTLFAPNEHRTTPFLHVDHQTLSHAGFAARAAQSAHVLHELGLVPGDRLALQVKKSPEALILYAACIRAGITLLPLNTAYTEEELRYFITDSAAACIICDPASAQTLAPLAPHLLTLAADGTGTLTDRAASAPTTFPPVPRSKDDLAALLYTSGTTGRPKGAMLTHENLLSNALTLRDLWGFTEQDTLIHALPIFHTHGLFVATNTILAAGAAMIFQPAFSTDAIIDALPRATTLMGVPTFYTRLLDDPRLTRDLTAHMRLFISGSAPLLAETHDRFRARTGHAILERYGMSETSMNSSNPLNGPRRPGTVGLPLPGVQIRVTASDGTPLPPGEIGEVELKGPNVFKGYWQMPDKTAESFRPDGFFRTGDLGLFEPDGYLQIVGRSKDLIISGGYNIYPREVEDFLDTQPGVLESAVIGLPHPDLGEAALALLVPEKGATPNLAAIQAAANKSLARFKHPRQMLIVDELPRNTMGKVQKALLRQHYATIDWNQMSEERKSAEVIQAFGLVRNPRLDNAHEGPPDDAVEEMLEIIEDLRRRVERRELQTLVASAVGAPGHADYAASSSSAHNYPAATVGLMELHKTWLSGVFTRDAFAEDDD